MINIFIIILLGLYIYYLLTVKTEEFNANTQDTQTYATSSFDKTDLVKVDMLPCSKQCCNYHQWSLPDELIKDSNVYIGTNITCGNSTQDGCVCMNQKDINVLSSRGGNA